MPWKARPPCAVPNCPGLAEPGRRHCAKHASVGARERADARARYTERKGTVAERGYGARWRRFRMMVLRDRPVCEDCGTAPSKDLHHVQKRADAGPDCEDNVLALCHSCHSRRTARGE